MALILCAQAYEGGDFDALLREAVIRRIEEAIEVQRAEHAVEEEMAARVNVLKDISQMMAEELGREATVEELMGQMLSNPLTDGLTLSGGEPFDQAGECAALAARARERGLDVWAYTGYLYEDLLEQGDADVLALLDQVDVLVDGPFVEKLKSYDALFRGSTNQRLIDVPKSRTAGTIVLWSRPDPLAHFTRPES